MGKETEEGVSWLQPIGWEAVGAANRKPEGASAFCKKVTRLVGCMKTAEGRAAVLDAPEPICIAGTGVRAIMKLRSEGGLRHVGGQLWRVQSRLQVLMLPTLSVCSHPRLSCECSPV